jgi:hypothetical protein
MSTAPKQPSMLTLREALEASWGRDTAYLGAYSEGNPALGNCYPTSRVVLHYFPDTEIVEGTVWTGESIEKHFWNILVVDGNEIHIDLSWQQFPPGSVVREYVVRDKRTLDDSEQTTRRVEILLGRVQDYLQR